MYCIYILLSIQFIWHQYPLPSKDSAHGRNQQNHISATYFAASKFKEKTYMRSFPIYILVLYIFGNVRFIHTQGVNTLEVSIFVVLMRSE